MVSMLVCPQTQFWNHVYSTVSHYIAAISSRTANYLDKFGNRSYHTPTLRLVEYQEKPSVGGLLGSVPSSPGCCFASFPGVRSTMTSQPIPGFIRCSKAAGLEKRDASVMSYTEYKCDTAKSPNAQNGFHSPPQPQQMELSSVWLVSHIAPSNIFIKSIPLFSLLFWNDPPSSHSNFSKPDLASPSFHWKLKRKKHSKTAGQKR